MKLTVAQVFALVPALTAILGEKRMLPLKGTYRLTRLRTKLAPEYQIIAAKRDEVILAYGYKGRPLVVGAPFDELQPEVDMVPPDKEAEFTAFWTAFGAETIEVDVEPIPLGQLELAANAPSPLLAAEIELLGDLIVDDSAAAKAA